MKKLKKFFPWIPRTLAILLIIFISLFSLDVFQEPQWFLALLIHLIPDYVFIILTIIAWKRAKLGGCLFLAGAIFLAFFTHLEALIIIVPVAIIGILFLIGEWI